MLIKAIVRCADAPPPGEIGEVEDEYGAFLIKWGKALSAESLAVRQGVESGPYAGYTSPQLSTELKARKLPPAGTKVQKAARLEADDLAPPPVEGPKFPKQKRPDKADDDDGGKS